MQTFVYGAYSKHRKHRTPKIGKPNINNQGAIYSMKKKIGRLCWPKFRQVSNRILRQTDIEPGDSAAAQWDQTTRMKKNGLMENVIRWLMWL